MLKKGSFTGLAGPDEDHCRELTEGFTQDGFQGALDVMAGSIIFYLHICNYTANMQQYYLFSTILPPAPGNNYA
jgi:hypothetical protein